MPPKVNLITTSKGETPMDSTEFLEARKRLGKTQKQLAELLGSSIKAVHSYEQGWRKVPGHIERQIFFLLSRKRGRDLKEPKACWTIKKCPLERKKKCPAWELQAGRLCWFINGTICAGSVQKNWTEKMKICRECEVLKSLL
jgi:DNA-binding transcriptional regulator YiaG